MKCHFCRNEINIDSPTLVIQELPNAVKMAKTIEQISEIEEHAKVYFCSTGHAHLQMISVICADISPFNDRIKSMAMVLGTLMAYDQDTPEFKEKLNKIRY